MYHRPHMNTLEKLNLMKQLRTKSKYLFVTYVALNIIISFDEILVAIPHVTIRDEYNAVFKILIAICILVVTVSPYPFSLSLRSAANFLLCQFSYQPQRNSPMPPTSDGDIRTVGCSVAKLIPDAEHLKLIREAVTRVHKATIFATELLNLHIMPI